jgi:hypothetical protein
MASQNTSEVAHLSLEERERILAEKEKALDEREKEVAKRENSFDRANLDQEWADLVDEQAKFYKTGPGLTSLAIAEKKQKLQSKKQQLKRFQGLLKAWERELRMGIVYPCYTNPYKCKYCGTDIWINGGSADPARNISSPDEFSEDSENSD